MADMSTGTNVFMKQILDAACVLYGNLDDFEYKSVIFGTDFPQINPRLV